MKQIKTHTQFPKRTENAKTTHFLEKLRESSAIFTIWRTSHRKIPFNSVTFSAERRRQKILKRDNGLR